MKKVTQLFAVLVIPILLTTACSSIANLKTATEYDTTANFDAYESYKFFKEVSYSDTFDNYSTENQRTIENAIHKQLKRKGMEETEIADLHVNFFVIDTHESERITNTSYRDQRYGGMTHLDTYIVDYEQGTLIVDFVDVKSKKLVWRGVATGVITGKQADMEDTINEAVNAVVSQYPPRSK